jgi:hypothetical protein
MIERVKFNVEDRMLSTGSNGDLPSSVAEAVLESLTASAGPDMMDLMEGPFRSPSNNNGTIGRSPFRKSSSTEDPYMERIITESSGSGSLFSNPSQKSFFSSNNDYSNERMLSVTNSWGGEVGGDYESSSFGFSQEFNNLLIGDANGPALRGRAQTAPCFGEHPFVSQLDPEHTLDEGYSKGMLGFGGGNLPPGFDKPPG